MRLGLKNLLLLFLLWPAGLLMALLGPNLRRCFVSFSESLIHKRHLGSSPTWICAARKRPNRRSGPGNPGGRRRYGSSHRKPPPSSIVEDSGRDGLRFFAACHPFLQQVCGVVILRYCEITLEISCGEDCMEISQVW